MRGAFATTAISSLAAMIRGYSVPWLLVAVSVSCTKKSSSAAEPEASDLVKRGRVVYVANCTACHAADPHKPGPLGPDVFGSSMELLDARIVRGEYPQGYVPKRKSQAMPKLLHLKDELPALHAFLNARP